MPQTISSMAAVLSALCYGISMGQNENNICRSQDPSAVKKEMAFKIVYTRSFYKLVTKRHHSVNFHNRQFRKYTFCREFINLIGDCNFCDDDFIIVTSLVLRTQSVQYIAWQQFSLTTLKCQRALRVKQGQ